MYISACLYVCLLNTYMPGALEDQKRILDPLELEEQMYVNHMWVLGTESRFSRTVSAVNH